MDRDSCLKVNNSGDIFEIKSKKLSLKKSVNSESIVNVVIPEGVTKIDEFCFYNCKNLKTVQLPSTLKHFGKHCFYCCDNLSEISLVNTDCNLGEVLPSSFSYARKENGRFYLYRDMCSRLDNLIRFEHPRLIECYLNNWDNFKYIQTLQNIDSDLVSYYGDVKGLSSQDIVKTILSKNLKNYKLLKKQLDYMYYDAYKEPFITLCEISGVFETQSISQKSNNIDYAQKSREFIKEKIRKYSKKCLSNFDFKATSGFKKDFADFLFKNFDVLKDKPTSFIKGCYEMFEEVQKSHTTNKGRCRQLAPTMEYFEKYFDRNKFVNVTPQTQHISDVIGKYYSKQKIFDRAVNIVNKNKKDKIPKNILPDDLKQTSFSEIKKKIQKIEALNKNTLETLNDIAENKFTYEFLRKDDVLNLVLGKLCNCCAHLDGVGDGIAVSAMINPNIQNLVIRNDKNEIVAKATLYVNRKQGYGLCNSFQVNDDVLHENTLNGKTIFEMFKKALTKFAEQYNKTQTRLYPKLKIINVGNSTFNSLSEYVSKEDIAEKLLKPFNFAKYSLIVPGYDGDADKEQFTIWREL